MEIGVDVHGIAGLGAVDEAGDGDQRTRSAGSAASDGDLGAFDVELWDTARVRIMDSELLNAKEVVSVGKRRRDSVGVCF